MTTTAKKTTKAEVKEEPKAETAAKAEATETKPAAKTAAKTTKAASKTTAKKTTSTKTTATKAKAASTTKAKTTTTKAAATKTTAAKASTTKAAAKTTKTAAKTTTKKTTATKTAATKAKAASTTKAKTTTTKAAATKTTAAKASTTKAAAKTTKAKATGAEEEALAKIQAAVVEAQAAIAGDDKAAAEKAIEATDKAVAAIEEVAAEEEAKKEAPVKAEAKAEEAKKVEEPKEAEPAKEEKVDSDEAKAEEPKVEVKEEPAPEFADLPPVLIAAAEAAPLAKTGGLADVVGALPKYLKELGVDARIIMPFHRIIKDRYRNDTTHLFDYNAGGQWASQFVGIDKLELEDGTIIYFVDNEYYFGGEIYAGDNFEGEQYGFFVQAVCDALPNLDFTPGIVHCNDWHTALAPFKIKARAAREGSWPPRTLLTIHNLAFQGMFGRELNEKLIGGDEHNYAWDLGVWNMMKAGIDTADYVNTVSPTYAWEITTPEFGEGLQDDLRAVAEQGRLWGILNGIDTDTWNPETDKCLPANYSLKDMSGKRECKRALLEELGLDGDVDAPLFAMVGRLTPQKGVNLVPHIIESCLPDNARFVILGTGYPELEWAMRDCENRHKGRVCSYIGYNSDLSHRIYAASDFFLMPSAFEPCGISQMIAMRYGSLPIVHETGGLKDTVQPYNQYTGEGVGFSFARFDGWDAVEACKRALSVFGDKDIMSRLIQNAMERDFGFGQCAHMYAELYRTMVQ